MNREDVYVDASPLIVLIKSDLEPLLPLVFQNIYITHSVYKEILAGPANDPAQNRVGELSWLIKLNTDIDEQVAEYGLGSGESETLSVGLKKANGRVLVDDAAARRCASQLKIPVIGTGGFLALAKHRGHLASLDAALRSVKSSGLWISNSLVDAILASDQTN